MFLGRITANTKRRRERMKIIELLNKLANGDEDIPKRFDFAGEEFNLNNFGEYRDEDGDNLFQSFCTDYSNLDDEILIIDKPNKIEKLNCLDECEYSKTLLAYKIDEIIDYINEGDK